MVAPAVPDNPDTTRVDSLYKRVSLELFHQYPGRIFLKLESWLGAVTMVELRPTDLAAISFLGDHDEGSGKKVIGVTIYQRGSFNLETGDR